jgi:hypothetical protein
MARDRREEADVLPVDPSCAKMIGH